jgi:hypothetical protein
LRTTAAGARYGLNVDAMLADTTVEQFNEWIARYRLEPWGDDWTQTGTIAAAVCNANGGKASPTDFVPGELQRSKGLTDAEAFESLRKIGG